MRDHSSMDPVDTGSDEANLNEYARIMPFYATISRALRWAHARLLFHRSEDIGADVRARMTISSCPSTPGMDLMTRGHARLLLRGPGGQGL